MFKYLIKGLMTVVAVKLLNDYRRVALQWLKIEAATGYVRGVQVARRSAIGLLRMGLLIGLMCVGALLFHVGLFILLPWSVEVRALLALGLGAGYLAVGVWSLRAMMNEQTWMEQSGATALVEEALRPTR